MLKHIAILTALVIGSFATAKADPMVTGNLDITGSAAFNTAGDIWFNGTGTVNNASTGDFASLTGLSSQIVNFNIFTTAAGTVLIDGCTTGTIHAGVCGPGAGNYYSITLDSLSPTNSITLLGAPHPPTFYDVVAAGYGTFNEEGDAPTSIYFDLTTQGEPGQFNSYSSLVIEAASPVPEPESLALFGTGLLGIVGIARRKFNV